MTHLERDNARMRALMLHANLHKTAPCKICNYNGPGFYHSDHHQCVADKAALTAQKKK